MAWRRWQERHREARKSECASWRTCVSPLAAWPRESIVYRQIVFAVGGFMADLSIGGALRHRGLAARGRKAPRDGGLSSTTGHPVGPNAAPVLRARGSCLFPCPAGATQEPRQA